MVGRCRVCCPLTPDPSPPAGARGDLVAGFQFSVFSLAGQFVALREALRWLGWERAAQRYSAQKSLFRRLFDSVSCSGVLTSMHFPR